jgi:predicted dehydrogenase
MTEKVRIGVIGLGIMGEQYTRIYSAHPLAEVVAVCNRSQPRLDEIADKYGIRARYTDYQDLLNDQSIDAVCIATPDYAHYEPVKAALAAGKHILCEKPFTTELAEADELLALSRKRPQQKLQVAFNHRWLSSYYHGYAVMPVFSAAISGDRSPDTPAKTIRSGSRPR